MRAAHRKRTALHERVDIEEQRVFEINSCLAERVEWNLALDELHILQRQRLAVVQCNGSLRVAEPQVAQRGAADLQSGAVITGRIASAAGNLLAHVIAVLAHERRDSVWARLAGDGTNNRDLRGSRICELHTGSALNEGGIRTRRAQGHRPVAIPGSISLEIKIRRRGQK